MLIVTSGNTCGTWANQETPQLARNTLSHKGYDQRKCLWYAQIARWLRQTARPWLLLCTSLFFLAIITIWAVTRLMR